MLSSFKSSCLSWFGILGGTMTVISGVQNVVDFSNWARFIVTAWADWINIVWDAVFVLVQINVNATSRYQMTMAIFIVGIAVGSRFSNLDGGKEHDNWHSGWDKIYNRRVGIAVLIFLFSIALAKTLEFFHVFQMLPVWAPVLYVAISALVYIAAIVVGLWDWPRHYAVGVAISMLLMSAIFQQVARSPLNDPSISPLLSGVFGNGAAILSGLIILCFAPPKAFMYRLGYIYLGMAMLVGLSEISKLGIDLTAPPT